ncbi:hypothetical protein [Stenotrophomonas phage A1432]|uniref:Uncharacterized protein n=1 Tax=Stenotrophomonas phage A1432 TaxID=2930315 RepID=A0A9E7N3V1_9CAUD|nr:hypothetical protein P9A45_gp10 [Stenotrophomonas phage A1432]UTC28020.1 hypothetical protein [Stenotrophomonas phage A1432]
MTDDATLDQQMSLRVSPGHRDFIRKKQTELKDKSPVPRKITEADAVRHIIEEAAARETAQ